MVHTPKQYALKKMICQTREGKYNFENEVKILVWMLRYLGIVGQALEYCGGVWGA